MRTFSESCIFPLWLFVKLTAGISAMLRECSQPDSFIPERYLDPESSLPDPREVVFGFGRRSAKKKHISSVIRLKYNPVPNRVCPGRHFAETSAWYLMANMLATLDISPSTEDRDKGVMPAFDVTPGFIRYVFMISSSIVPRVNPMIAQSSEALWVFHLPPL